MNNGRCRMRGGNCRGPTTEEGRARPSRVFSAMAAARLAFHDLAPLIVEVHVAFGISAPTPSEGAEAAGRYACRAVFEPAANKAVTRWLTMLIRDCRRKPKAQALAIFFFPHDAMHRERGSSSRIIARTRANEFIYA